MAAAQQPKGRTSLKRPDIIKEDIESVYEEDNPYEKMLDLQNVCGHTPFFVSVVKGHLSIASILI